MTEKQIIVKDLLVNYYFTDNPDPAATTVIFLHGWRAEAKVWNPVVFTLAKDPTWRIYELDLPGFGRSSIPSGSYELADYAVLIREFIEKLELKKPILVGHSFGGRIAIKFAALFPELVGKLVLVDSAGIREPDGLRPWKKVLAKILKPLFAPRFMKPLRQKFYQIIGAEDYVATPELTKTFLNIVNEDLTEALRQIQMPTLIVWGENDRETPLESGEKMHRLIKKSKLEVLAGAGHFSFLDQLEKFISILSDFLHV